MNNYCLKEKHEDEKLFCSCKKCKITEVKGKYKSVLTPTNEGDDIDGFIKTVKEVCNSLIYHGRHFSPKRDKIVLKKSVDHIGEAFIEYLERKKE